MPYLDELVNKTKAEQRGVEGILEGSKATAQLHEGPIKPVVEQGPQQHGAPSSESEKVLIEKYGNVRIYRVKGEALYKYEVPTPHYRGEEKALIGALIEIASKVISPEREVGKSNEQRRFAYYQKILDIIDSSPELRVPPAMKEFYADTVTKEMAGWGLIDSLLTDDNLEDILLIGPNCPAYVFHRKYDMMKTNVMFYDDRDIKDLIDRIARNVGRHIDIQSPLLDARLPDGTRVNATVPPASVNGSTLSIRKFRADPITAIDQINFGTLNYEAAAFLWLATDGFGAKPANIVIAGGTASGKTTLLNTLASFVPNNERVLSIEDTAELSLPLEHWVRFETRPPGLEGVGEITMDMLVKNSLRMRPDRILVGEIRGEEGHTLFSAMNTGHDGCMGTLHSNSAKETLVRLSNPPISVPLMMLESLTFIIMQQRINDRRKGLIRRVTEIAEVIPTEDQLPKLQMLYQWDPAKDVLHSTGLNSVYLQTLGRYTGFSKATLEEEVKTRAKILQELNNRNIRSLKEVCSVTQNYILKTRGKI
ncbi:TPA: CpaF family protein [Candidatus Micrarchaeota archaeon]|nr:CpaF family protein [Candidatus Micrarchaeota archaeon]